MPCEVISTWFLNILINIFFFVASYTIDDSEKFKSIVAFECRGIEPVDYRPTDGWIVSVEESNKVFNDVDLSEKEWVEYDEKIQDSVGIYEFEYELK